MDDWLAAALPLAMAAAVSPGLLAIVLLILGSTPRPKARAWYYLAGVLTVILAVGFIGLAAVRSVVAAVGALSSGWSLGVRLSLAVLLFGLGWRYLRPRTPGSAGRRPGLEDRLRAARPPVFLLLGVGTMLTNWSSLILYLSALEVIDAAASGVAVTGLASGVVLLITIGPLLVPVLAVTVAGHRADPLLARMGQFSSRYSRQIIAGIYFVLAALIAGSALSTSWP